MNELLIGVCAAVFCVIFVVAVVYFARKRKPATIDYVQGSMEVTAHVKPDPVTKAIQELTLEATGAHVESLAAHPETNTAHIRKKKEHAVNLSEEGPTARSIQQPDTTDYLDLDTSLEEFTVSEQTVIGEISVETPAFNSAAAKHAFKKKKVDILVEIANTDTSKEGQAAASVLAAAAARFTGHEDAEELTIENLAYVDAIENNEHLQPYSKQLSYRVILKEKIVTIPFGKDALYVAAADVYIKNKNFNEAVKLLSLTDDACVKSLKQTVKKKRKKQKRKKAEKSLGDASDK